MAPIMGVSSYAVVPTPLPLAYPVGYARHTEANRVSTLTTTTAVTPAYGAPYVLVPRVLPGGASVLQQHQPFLAPAPVKMEGLSTLTPVSLYYGAGLTPALHHQQLPPCGGLLPLSPPSNPLFPPVPERRDSGVALHGAGVFSPF